MHAASSEPVTLVLLFCSMKTAVKNNFKVLKVRRKGRRKKSFESEREIPIIV